MARQPASDSMVLEAGLLSGHRGATEQPGTSPPMFADCWVPPRFEQDPTSLGEAIAGGQPASDQMVLEARLISGPRGATTTPSGVLGKGKDGRPSLRHEATSDAAPTTAGQADHAGASSNQEGTEVPPSSPSKAYTTAMPSAQCMDTGPQAEAADGTATSIVQANDELTAEGTPTPREATK